MGERFHHSLISIRSYFKPAGNESLFGEALQTLTGEVSSTQLCIARDLNASMRQKETSKKSELASDDRKQEVGFYVNKHAILAARKCPFGSYKGYEFKRETVGDWRNLYPAKYIKEETTGTVKITFKGSGRPSMVSPNWQQKSKWFCLIFEKLCVKCPEKQPLQSECCILNLQKYWWKLGALSNWPPNELMEFWGSWKVQRVEGQLQSVK